MARHAPAALALDLLQEAQHANGKQVGVLLVVGGKAAVGEQVALRVVHEQLRGRHGLRQLTRLGYVAETLGVIRVDLQRNALAQEVFEPQLFGVRHSVVEAGEGLARIEVRRVDSVSRRPQRVGEGDNTGGQSLRVMKQKDLSYTRTTLCEQARATPSPRAKRSE